MLERKDHFHRRVVRAAHDILSRFTPDKAAPAAGAIIFVKNLK